MNHEYEKPGVEDLGDLVALTQAAGLLNAEDGSGKTIQAGVDGVAGVSIAINP